MCLMLLNQEYSLILALSGTATTRQLPDIRSFGDSLLTAKNGRYYLSHRFSLLPRRADFVLQCYVGLVQGIKKLLIGDGCGVVDIS